MASTNSPPPKPNDLPPITRLITDHDASGRAVFSTALPATVPGTTIYNGAVFTLGYTTHTQPARLAGASDISAYAADLASPPAGLVVPGGTVARFVDMPPGSESPMHRTASLDYGVVLEGEVELVLDGGEARAMRRGDMAVQRGTMHAWRNASVDRWARMMYVLQECEPVEAGGRVLAEDYGEMAGKDVKSSG